MKDAVLQSYDTYRDEHHVGYEMWAHDWGWKEGAEWILTELLMNKKIKKETMEKYMEEINKINIYRV
jgi:hypothetical protein